MFIKDCGDSVNPAPRLELIESVKLYVLAMHVMEFAEKNVWQQRVEEEKNGKASHGMFSQHLESFKALRINDAGRRDGEISSR